ncbi:hypothetical protein PF005_g28076, partial [Phytophthora fragariae]
SKAAQTGYRSLW